MKVRVSESVGVSGLECVCECEFVSKNVSVSKCECVTV